MLYERGLLSRKRNNMTSLPTGFVGRFYSTYPQHGSNKMILKRT